MASRRASAFDGVDVALGELDRLTSACRDGLQKVIKESTARIQSNARARLRAAQGRGHVGPYQTVEAIRRITFDNGDTGVVYVGKTRDEKGKLRPAMLPLWIEYGTIKQYSRPFLIPAFAVERSTFDANALRLLETAAKS